MRAPLRGKGWILWLLAFPLAFATLAGAVLIHRATTGPKERSALAGEGGTRLTIGVRPGHVFAYGQPTVWNRTGEPITLRAAHLVDPSPGLHLVGAYVTGADATGPMAAFNRRFPPAHKNGRRPLPGYVVPPRGTREWREGTQVILALRTDRTGRFGFRRIAIDYEQNGERDTIERAEALLVCIGPNAAEHQCKGRIPALPHGDVAVD